MIRVLIADDHTVVREGIRHLLEETPGISVVGEACDGDEAVQLATSLVPDVLVLDLTMPGKTGLQVTQLLKLSQPGIRVLILSMHDHAEYVLGAVRAGAGGYLLKDAAPAEIREAVRALHRGEEVFSPRIASQLSAALRGDLLEEDDRLARLTPRERDVLRGIASGLSNKGIAAELGISPRTVETHRESLIAKLEIKAVAGLTRFAIETGVVAG